MTAMVYGVMLLLETVPRETGFTSVSRTQFAVGSPVIIGMVGPGPGRAMVLAACITADASVTDDQISLEMEGGSETPVVPRRMSTCAMVAQPFVESECSGEPES